MQEIKPLYQQRRRKKTYAPHQICAFHFRDKIQLTSLSDALEISV